MDKHTPGPWTIGRPTEFGIFTPGTVFAGDEGVAQVYGLPANGELAELAPLPKFAGPLANARLIAAAPELLEALQDVVRWRDLVDSGDDALDDRYADMHLDSALTDARAAIAKATGAAP